MTMNDIPADFSSTLGQTESPRWATLRAGDLLPHSVESYIAGFRSPAIRDVIAVVTNQLAADPDAAKPSRTENGFLAAKQLAEIGRQITDIAGMVRTKSAQSSTVSLHRST
jgi:hypothetical protein